MTSPPQNVRTDTTATMDAAAISEVHSLRDLIGGSEQDRALA